MRWPVVGAAIRAAMRRPTRASTRSFWKSVCVASADRLSDELLDAVAASQRENSASWFGFAERIMSAGGLHADLVVGDRWERVRAPVLFAWGDHDAFGPPAEGVAVAARMHDARVVTIRGAGHLPWLDEPEATAQAIRSFLDA
jgi:pimeloyl-ACP methyl ester carboxylesterase